MAETIRIPGKKRKGAMDSSCPMSKSMPANFYSRAKPPPAPRHRPLRSKEDPEALQLPPPSPLDDHKISEQMLLGRSLTKTTPAQLLYPSSLPSRFMNDPKRLRDLSLTPKRQIFLSDSTEEASPSSSVHSTKDDTEHEEPNVGSQPFGSFTLYQILEEGNSNDKASVLTDPHALDDDIREDEPRMDGIFEMEDD